LLTLTASAARAQELQSDLDLPGAAFPDGHLLPWAERGVLLLNTCLTVRYARPIGLAWR
jgi:uracil-DNA glycosylase